MTSVGLIPSSYLAASSSQSFSIPDILCFIYCKGEGKGEGKGVSIHKIKVGGRLRRRLRGRVFYVVIL